MKLFLLLLTISFPLMAQIDTGNGAIANCTDADIVNGGNVQCGDLTISGAFPGFNASIPAVDIQVLGDVLINSNLDLDGTDAPNADNAFGKGLGGPGAGDGGSPNFGTPEDGPGISGGGAGNTVVCGSGGGGGGFALAGSAGSNCAAAAGGIAGPAFTSIFSGVLRGGFGGGAGGDTGTTLGPGGGGGGALRIRAGGNIVINGIISANGGNGGASGSDGGGGGGGSGGLIWIQAIGNITINANMFASGGAGGNGAGTGGGNGSAGGRGAIRFDDMDGVISGTGSLPGYAQVNSFTSITSPKLNSSISCGMVGAKDQSHLQFSQMFLGFILALGFSFAFKRSSKLFS